MAGMVRAATWDARKDPVRCATVTEMRRELGRLYARATTGASYDADDRDHADIAVLGLAFPSRATVALLLATILVLLDYMRVFIPPEVRELAREPGAARVQAIERL